MRPVLTFSGVVLLCLGGLAVADDEAASPVPGAAEAELPAIQSQKPQGAHGRHDPHATLSAEQHLTVALQHQMEGRDAEAMFTLTKAIASFPADAKLRLVRGSLYLQKQQISKALEDFEMAVQLEPTHSDAYVSRAQAYRHFNRTGDVLADLDKAVELAPDSIPARFNRGSVNFAEGAIEKALEDFDYCVAVDPHTAAPYFNRAAAYDALGRRDEAMADMKRFLELAESPEWKKAAEDILRRWSEEKTEAVSTTDDGGKQ